MSTLLTCRAAGANSPRSEEYYVDLSFAGVWRRKIKQSCNFDVELRIHHGVVDATQPH